MRNNVSPKLRRVLTIGALFAAVPFALYAAPARDPGLNQPGVVGNVGVGAPGVGVGAPGVGVVDPGINQPGAAGNVGRDPGFNQPGRAGNVRRR